MTPRALRPSTQGLSQSRSCPVRRLASDRTCHPSRRIVSIKVRPRAFGRRRRGALYTAGASLLQKHRQLGGGELVLSLLHIERLFKAGDPLMRTVEAAVALNELPLQRQDLCLILRRRAAWAVRVRLARHLVSGCGRSEDVHSQTSSGPRTRGDDDKRRPGSDQVPQLLCEKLPRKSPLTRGFDLRGVNPLRNSLTHKVSAHHRSRREVNGVLDLYLYSRPEDPAGGGFEMRQLARPDDA